MRRMHALAAAVQRLSALSVPRRFRSEASVHVLNGKLLDYALERHNEQSGFWMQRYAVETLDGEIENCTRFVDDGQQCADPEVPAGSDVSFYVRRCGPFLEIVPGKDKRRVWQKLSGKLVDYSLKGPRERQNGTKFWMQKYAVETPDGEVKKCIRVVADGQQHAEPETPIGGDVSFQVQLQGSGSLLEVKEKKSHVYETLSGQLVDYRLEGPRERANGTTYWMQRHAVATPGGEVEECTCFVDDGHQRAEPKTPIGSDVKFLVRRHGRRLEPVGVYENLVGKLVDYTLMGPHHSSKGRKFWEQCYAVETPGGGVERCTLVVDDGHQRAEPETPIGSDVSFRVRHHGTFVDVMSIEAEPSSAKTFSGTLVAYRLDGPCNHAGRRQWIEEYFIKAGGEVEKCLHLADDGQQRAEPQIPIGSDVSCHACRRGDCAEVFLRNIKSNPTLSYAWLSGKLVDYRLVGPLSHGRRKYWIQRYGVKTPGEEVIKCRRFVGDGQQCDEPETPIGSDVTFRVKRNGPHLHVVHTATNNILSGKVTDITHEDPIIKPDGQRPLVSWYTLSTPQGERRLRLVATRSSSRSLCEVGEDITCKVRGTLLLSLVLPEIEEVVGELIDVYRYPIKQSGTHSILESYCVKTGVTAVRVVSRFVQADDDALASVGASVRMLVHNDGNSDRNRATILQMKKCGEDGDYWA
eukprot:Hpha_TRINITY_DN14966_c0_g1::TRINITY_DN14966_c0_g1_i4::g.143480::m.143480